jgi:Ulp1 family protease
MSLSIKKLSDDVFTVTVAETSTTTHTVTITDQSLNDLTDNNVTKTQLLDFSFKFLLEREPNTSILSSFDINVISKYFSDYRDKVRRWCDESQN